VPAGVHLRNAWFHSAGLLRFLFSEAPSGRCGTQPNFLFGYRNQIEPYPRRASIPSFAAEEAKQTFSDVGMQKK
jgi:hypothetical protein